MLLGFSLSFNCTPVAVTAAYIGVHFSPRPFSCLPALKRSLKCSTAVGSLWEKLC